MPLESEITEKLHDAINCEIVMGTISNKQEAVDWLTWTFLFRRLAPNPNYYNLSGRTPQNLNDFISQLIEDTVEDLVGSKCISVDEENEFDLTPQNVGRIAAFYDVSYKTISLFAKHLDDEKILSQKLKALLQILTQAAEFEHLPIREGEESLLASIA
jgi:pre-mRNA-splicing helicase BRR2